MTAQQTLITFVCALACCTRSLHALETTIEPPLAPLLETTQAPAEPLAYIQLNAAAPRDATHPTPESAAHAVHVLIEGVDGVIDFDLHTSTPLLLAEAVVEPRDEILTAVYVQIFPFQNGERILLAAEVAEAHHVTTKLNAHEGIFTIQGPLTGAQAKTLLSAISFAALSAVERTFHVRINFQDLLPCDAFATLRGRHITTIPATSITTLSPQASTAPSVGGAAASSGDAALDSTIDATETIETTPLSTNGPTISTALDWSLITLHDAVRTTARFAGIARLLDQAGALSLLEEHHVFSVVLPTDEALERAAEWRTTVQSHPAALAAVVAAYTFPGFVTPATLQGVNALTNQQGAAMSVYRSSSTNAMTINGMTVVDHAVTANGVVLLVDGVPSLSRTTLVPADVITTQTRFSTFFFLLRQAGLENLLYEPYLVLAPTDAALQTLNMLLLPTTSDARAALQRYLQAHFIPFEATRPFANQSSDTPAGPLRLTFTAAHVHVNDVLVLRSNIINLEAGAVVPLPAPALDTTMLTSAVWEAATAPAAATLTRFSSPMTTPTPSTTRVTTTPCTTTKTSLRLPLKSALVLGTWASAASWRMVLGESSPVHLLSTSEDGAMLVFSADQLASSGSYRVGVEFVARAGLCPAAVQVTTATTGFRVAVDQAVEHQAAHDPPADAETLLIADIGAVDLIAQSASQTIVISKGTRPRCTGSINVVAIHLSQVVACE
ncbi:uncharacterized protein MONBRDRAFT_22621 [Monosiga brevicollis MX1]|uniref:FAS1 domain-containing protein n=1 Tax=Monosiga brevicollis TaxID=81824 RepID=A9UNK0_MONBE|nr:uncharacterized protein MONBRDRAFT_22621 [Monosiga brevicollis MX1]EDQ93151.1 predicted protein [Monosiga brevicollis MX1]|eukprot:XP_001742913.1 hypothetical protein [Monosiga brevicollis MX1]